MMNEPKYLTVSQNGKTKRIQNGWLILRDEMKISRATLLFYFQHRMPALAVWNIVKKARKKREPQKFALFLLRRLLDRMHPNGEKVSQIEEKAPDLRSGYHDPYKD